MNRGYILLKGDAVIRVPREAWHVGKVFSAKTGVDLRLVTAAALNEYVKREEARKP